MVPANTKVCYGTGNLLPMIIHEFYAYQYFINNKTFLCHRLFIILDYLSFLYIQIFGPFHYSFFPDAAVLLF